MEIFKDGNILSLHLKDFQTFKHQKFTFGPSLNLIAAPNGSGKSSVANAIAFLFNGTPRTIGKSKQITDFIRFGCKEAEISAEIFFRENKIRLSRRISLNHSNYFINDKLTAQKEYYKIINEMGIDVNNLCTFLPQERVGEFCHMDGHELLKEVLDHRKSQNNTENPYLNLELLNKLYDTIQEIETSIDGSEKQKSLVLNTMNILESDIKELEDKENKELRLRKLEYFKLYLEYKGYKNNYKEVKVGIDDVNKRIECNNNEISEIKKMINEIEEDGIFKEYKMNVNILRNQNDELNKLEKELKECNFNTEKKKMDLDSLCKKKEEKHEIIKAKTEELESERTLLNEKMEEINRELKLFENKVDKMYENPRFSDVLVYNINLNKSNERIKVLKPNDLLITDLSSLSNKVEMMVPSTRKIDEKLQEIRSSMSQIQHISEIVQRKTEDLENSKLAYSKQGDIRMEMLKKYHLDTYKGVQWLRSNSHTFKQEVLEPSYLHLHIHKDYSDYVETFLSFQALSSFIVQNDEDFSKLTKILKDQMKLSINVATLATNKVEGLSRKYIESFQLDGVASDFIEGRKEYIDFLNIYGHFNWIPILKENSTNENINNQKDPKYSLEMEIFNKCENVKRMAIYGRYSEIRRSKYNDDYIIVTNQIIPKGLFKFPKINIQEIDTKLLDLKRERETNKIQMQKLLEEKEDLDGKKSYIKKEFDVSHINRLIFHVKRHVANKQFFEETIESLKSSSLEPEISKITEELLLFEIHFTKTMEKLSNLLDKENIPKFDLEKIKDLQLDIENNKRKLFILESQSTVEQNNLKSLFTNKNSLRILIEKLKETMSTYPKYDNFSDVTQNIDELENEIALIKAKLCVSSNKDYVKNDYNEKKTHFNKLSENIGDLRCALEKYKSEYENEKKKLEDEIKKFISPVNEKFKIMFERFKFTGELRLDTSARNWELKIMVKFRPEEELQQLSSFRQSGGEKSLSTILFLLALQQCDYVPFRLADEINQGMDPINEKMVFEILKEMSSSSQIFIITPKLVEGLEFSENTKAIIIYGGVGITKDIEVYTQSILL